MRFLLYGGGVLFVGLLACSCDLHSDSGNPGLAGGAPQGEEEVVVLTTNWPLSEEAAQALQKTEAEQSKVPVFSRLDLGKGVSLDLVFIPPGTFPMGNPSVSSNPPRLVRISKGFLISKHEITWGQLVHVLGMTVLDVGEMRDLNIAKRDGEHWENYPATGRWTLGDMFCEKLSEAQGIKARLITEAEWEYACRAGTVTPYGAWDPMDETKANVSHWLGPDGKEVYSKRPHDWVVAVGRYPANFWGVHDIMGNADEWCLDAYSDRMEIAKLPSVDPVAIKRGGVFRVYRGGSVNGAQTVFFRDGYSESGSNKGIRLVIEIDDAIRAKLIELK